MSWSSLGDRRSSIEESLSLKSYPDFEILFQEYIRNILKNAYLICYHICDFFFFFLNIADYLHSVREVSN